jgi:hypothetical protein
MRTRIVQIARPTIYPACCIGCAAVENSDRTFFVDLGFDISHMFDARPEGLVYMCDVCLREYVKAFMNIIEEQARTLKDVTLGGPRTDPIFDGYRETIDSIERRVDENGSDSDAQAESSLTASFGG